MKDHTDCIRGFYRLSKIHHQPGDNISISIGMYQPGEGTTGEFGVEWVDLGGGMISPRLKVFNDAWHALSLFKDMLEGMAELDDQNISEEEFCQFLIGLGIVDLTPVDKPKVHRKKANCLTRALWHWDRYGGIIMYDSNHATVKESLREYRDMVKQLYPLDIKDFGFDIIKRSHSEFLNDEEIKILERYFKEK